MKLNFTGQHYVSENTNEATINLFPEIETVKGQVILRGTPGLDLLQTISGHPIRALHVCSADETKLYAVLWNGFYIFNADFSWTRKGSIGTTEGVATIQDNGLQIAVTDGSALGYVYDLSTKSFSTISGAGDFAGSATLAFIDGMIIAHDPGTQVMRSSAIYDLSSWNALDKAEAEGDPDPIVALSTNHKELYVHGSLSSEVWYNSANPTGFPFSRMTGAVIPFGLGAAQSVSYVLGNSYMLGRTDKGERVALEVSQYQPNIVSHPGINHEIGQLLATSDAEGFSYMQDGHAFYVLTFPRGDRTFVFDASTRMWHRRKSYGMGRWRARCYAFFQGKHIVGDYATGNIYELKTTKYTENGQPIERIKQVREISEPNDAKNIFVDELQLDIETGVGDGSLGQGKDPVASIRWSADNCKTWGNDHFKGLGKQGEYRKRVTWTRLGKYYSRVFELRITDPVPVVLRGCWIKARKGIS